MSLTCLGIMVGIQKTTSVEARKLTKRFSKKSKLQEMPYFIKEITIKRNVNILNYR